MLLFSAFLAPPPPPAPAQPVTDAPAIRKAWW